MNATIRIGPAHWGHASGSTSKICCSNAAQRREASVGASRGVVTIGTGASAAASFAWQCQQVGVGKVKGVFYEIGGSNAPAVSISVVEAFVP
jgi:hypothetical protein